MSLVDFSVQEATEPVKATVSRGFWKETWRRFRRRKLGMAALGFVVFLTLVAIFTPCIVGTKPIICYYKGAIYFPAMSYYNARWENPVFAADKFRKLYPQNLATKDPDSWAIWPLVYQDPYQRVQDGDWGRMQDGKWVGESGNPTSIQGRPSRRNWFGTTGTGVDVFAQMVYGTTTALLVGFVSMGIASAIGITVGACAGFFGGWTDIALSRIIEVVMCVPTLVLVLAMLAIVEKPTVWHVMVVLGLTGWTGIARLTRAEFLKLRETEFVTAARALGVKPLRIIFRHILPNALAPVLVPITFGIAGAILIESGLSFLGIGGAPPNPSWGAILKEGQRSQLWWLVVFPGMAVFSAVLAYNLIGEGLQEAADPRLREAGK